MEDTRQVDVNNILPILLTHLIDRHMADNTCRSYQCIHLAPTLDHLRNDMITVRLTLYIAGNCHDVIRIKSFLLQQRHRLIQCRLRKIRIRNLSSLSKDSFADCLCHITCACDQYSFSCKTFHFYTPFSCKTLSHFFFCEMFSAILCLYAFSIAFKL